MMPGRIICINLKHVHVPCVMVKILLILLVISGLAQPIEPILSIHRAGRISKLLSQSSPPVNETVGDVFEHDSSVDIDNGAKLDHSDGNVNKTVKEANYTRNEALLYAIASASLVGLSGIFPLLIFSTVKDDIVSKSKGDSKLLNRLLSFAVGGLLGDVFLHLLPESWEHLTFVGTDGIHNHWPATQNGMWVLVGLISFCMLEKMFPDSDKMTHESNPLPKTATLNANHNNNNTLIKKNGFISPTQNGLTNLKQKEKKSAEKIKTSGYLNLLANFIDNFTHGLAVGGSYLVSRHVGILTTLAILLHEIPHEVGDFAILLRAGFDRWHAAKLQILTAAGGLLGTCVAFAAESAKSAGDRVAWILPFTSGGFIYVALCTVVPDILKETNPRESCVQILTIVLAIGVMHAVSYIA